MKQWVLLVLALGMTLGLCACGGTASEPASPYAGVWTAVSAEFGGTDVPIEEVFTDGMVLELKGNGVCQLSLGDDTDPASWSAEDGTITISDGETDLTGTVSEEAIVLDISGMNITLTRDGDDPTEESAEEAS